MPLGYEPGGWKRASISAVVHTQLRGADAGTAEPYPGCLAAPAEESQMPSIYDVIAESCAALAGRTGRTSDKVRLLQLADQWRTVPADGQGPGKKPPVAASLAGDMLLAPTPESPKKAADEIKSDPRRAKEYALDRVRDAIGVLRELGIADDTILSQLGFGAERKHRRRTG
jgi:hypothetical protein